MGINIRIDDITPKMDWESFEKFVKLLNQYNIKPLLGVVPCCEDDSLNRWNEREDFWEFIKSLYDEGYPIAMHGYDHVYISQRKGIFPIKDKSEFAGVPFEIQEEKVRKGKEILESHGIKTNIFMPPGHTFDKNTLQILQKYGFRYITAGFGKERYVRHGMIFLPICTSIRNIRRIARTWNEATIVIHCNGMTESTLQRYREELKYCQQYGLDGYDNAITGNDKRVRNYIFIPWIREKLEIIQISIQNCLHNTKQKALRIICHNDGTRQIKKGEK